MADTPGVGAGQRVEDVFGDAPPLKERISAFADGAALTLTRTGPLFRVAGEAEAIEPDIARAFAAARADTLATSRRMWQRLADDGLLHPGVDVDWVAETTGLLAAADTYLLIQATLQWAPDQLRSWLYRTWMHLATLRQRRARRERTLLGRVARWPATLALTPAGTMDSAARGRHLDRRHGQSCPPLPLTVDGTTQRTGRPIDQSRAWMAR